MRFKLWGKARSSKGSLNEAAVSDDGDVYALTERRKQFSPEFRPFLNPTFGNQMNQNIAFGGTQEIIHNGETSTEWTAAVGAGTWDFSTGDVITLTAADNADFATFSEETPTTIDMSGFSVLTGVVNLTTYSDINHDMIIGFDLAGVAQGNSVDIDDFIDASLLGTAQSFAIPLTEFGIATQSVDGFTIAISRVGGSKPTMTFDDITIQATGDPAIFTVATLNENEEFHVTDLKLTFVDAVLTTALLWDGFLAVTKLSAGIGFRRVKDGETDFSATFRQMADMVGAGGVIGDIISDGTDTMLTVTIPFPEPVILTGSPDNNFITFTINDNLATLLLFTAVARGSVVTNNA